MCVLCVCIFWIVLGRTVFLSYAIDLTYTRVHTNARRKKRFFVCSIFLACMCLCVFVCGCFFVCICVYVFVCVILSCACVLALEKR